LYDQLSPVIGGAKQPIPAPSLCPDCRNQRRLAFRNERKLYKRDCDLCKKSFISLYSPDKPYKVYCLSCWFGDGWDPLEYGMDFDFSRPFFEQYRELLSKVPLIGSMVFSSVNCDYNSYIVDSKDCYMSVRIEGEDVFYSYLAVKCTNCVDGYNNYKCELCYECIDCWNCYNCDYSQLCKNCSDCYFCYDCIGCKNCFGSVGLRNKEYYFFNQPYSKEEYERKVAEYKKGSFVTLKHIKKAADAALLSKPHRANYIFQSENVFGDFISESKDVYNSYDVEKADVVRHSMGVEYSKIICDSNFIYYGENCYENIGNAGGSNIRFSFAAIAGVYNLLYSMLCVNSSHDCFGSLSLKHQEYCILNKKYSKEEYEALLPKIIEHMRQAGEWGEFFPVPLSTFYYNESVAQQYYPLSKEEALARGFAWKDEDARGADQAYYQVPDRIADIPDSILKETLGCSDCGRSYKIVAKELDFYRKKGLSVPRLCPDCRYRRRKKQRTPPKLWDRKCDNCSANIQTSYSPDRPEIVYCEQCYLKEVY